jgi:hypothetical protein
MITKHEPYSLDLLNYEIYQTLAARLQSLPANRFCGVRVRGSLKRSRAIQKRERRLQKYGMTVLMFAS